MSSNFKKRLKQLHDSRQRRRGQSHAGPSRVFTADDVDLDDVDNDGVDNDPLNTEGAEPAKSGQPGVARRWRDLGARARPTGRGDAHLLRQTHPPTHQHGRHRLEEGLVVDLASFDAAHTDAAIQTIGADELVYVDLETTGLSKSSYPFCVGIGRWHQRTFVVDHYVMTTADDEPAVLAACADIFDDAAGLCTFNGASFDLPMLARRFGHHDITHPLANTDHLDLLNVARRRLPDRDSHKLSRLEEDVLDFERHADIPGARIPRRWQRYLDDGQPGPLMDVFDHNRLDIVSMVVLLAALAPGGPSSAAKPADSTPPSAVASRLSRTYALRKKSKNRPAGSRSASAPAGPDSPSGGDPQSATGQPQRVELGPQFSRSKLRDTMPVGTRLRTLRAQVERRLDDDSHNGPDNAVLADLHQMLALAPRHPFALDKIVAYYRRHDQPGLADHFARRLQDTSPY